MEPEDKAPSIDKLLTDISGKDRPTVIRNNQCVFCENPDLNFRDDVSRHEYRISGQCQRCQDDFFGA